MFGFFASLLLTWIVATLAVVLYLLLSKPGKWLLDLNPICFRLPRPNVNDRAYVRHKRVIPKVEKICVAKIVNPKSAAVDGEGRVYCGSIDGSVYCLSPPDSGVGGGASCELVTSFVNGRPLGVRLVRNLLYVIEANSGLYTFDLHSSTLTQLLALDEAKFLDGKASKFFDDLVVVQENGDEVYVYITDVSRKFPIDMWCYSYLEPDSTGRILRFDVKRRLVTVLLDNLCFPNGIEVTEDNQSLLVCELTKRRILRHFLKGPNAGQTTVLIDNLPGEPENIRKSLQSTFWIGLALTRDYNDKLSFLDDYSTEPNLRKLILRSCYVLGSLLAYCGHLLNNSCVEERGKSLQSGLALILSDFMTSPGMAVEIDLNGNILQTVQVKNDMSVISEVNEVRGNDQRRILYTTSSGGNLSMITLD